MFRAEENNREEGKGGIIPLKAGSWKLVPGRGFGERALGAFPKNLNRFSSATREPCRTFRPLLRDGRCCWSWYCWCCYIGGGGVGGAVVGAGPSTGTRPPALGWTVADG